MRSRINFWSSALMTSNPCKSSSLSTFLVVFLVFFCACKNYISTFGASEGRACKKKRYKGEREGIKRSREEREREVKETSNQHLGWKYSFPDPPSVNLSEGYDFPRRNAPYST